MDSSMVTLMGYTFNLYGALLLGLFLFFLGAFWRAQRKGHLNWTDMITRDGTKVSTTKILQMVGGIVGTWIMVQMTLKGQLTWDMFAIYLGYVASIDGFSKLVMAKYGAAEKPDRSFRRPRYDEFDDDGVTPPRRPTGSAKTTDFD